jgi:hypothetical protein
MSSALQNNSVAKEKKFMLAAVRFSFASPQISQLIYFNTEDGHVLQW